MGYSVRVDKFRYTEWVGFNQTEAVPAFHELAGAELYVHDEPPLPVDWAVEHVNRVHDPAMSTIVAKLRTVLLQCGQRPDQCPPALLVGLVP